MRQADARDTTDLFRVDNDSGENHTGGLGEREADPHRLEQRQRQVAMGKNTLGYTNYRKAVPKLLVRPKDMPKWDEARPETPDIYQVCSKRAFLGQISRWRRLLHAWDPTAGEGAEVITVGGRSATKQESRSPLQPLRWAAEPDGWGEEAEEVKEEGTHAGYPPGLGPPSPASCARSHIKREQEAPAWGCATAAAQMQDANLMKRQRTAPDQQYFEVSLPPPPPLPLPSPPTLPPPPPPLPSIYDDWDEDIAI